MNYVCDCGFVVIGLLFVWGICVTVVCLRILAVFVVLLALLLLDCFVLLDWFCFVLLVFVFVVVYL